MNRSRLRLAGAGREAIHRRLCVGIPAETCRLEHPVLEVLERNGIEVVTLSTCPEESVGDERKPDVVVVATGGSTPSLNDALATLDLPGVPVVWVCPRFSRATLEVALQSGVQGFVRAEDVERCIVPTVVAVSVGQVVLPSGYGLEPSRRLLSAREKQVLSMVVLGFTNLEIANKLYITETTVKSHLSSAYRKLGVRSRGEATALILSDDSLGLGILTLSGERVAS